jgi:hypothetical protein
LVSGELALELLEKRSVRVHAALKLRYVLDERPPLALENRVAARNEIVDTGGPSHAQQTTTEAGRGHTRWPRRGRKRRVISPAVPSIYHFTDIDNLAPILAAGELRCHSTADCAVDVADATIKARRMSKRVPCGPGGTVGQYVPFYFAPRSPMLFRIQRGGVEGVSADPARLVYMVSSTEPVVDAGHACVFTDGNAAAAFTDFHDDLDLLDDVVDWPLMRARYWSNNEEDNDRVRRRCAEFLVHHALPFELVDELCVHDATARAAVRAAVAASGQDVAVTVRANWYF